MTWWIKLASLPFGVINSLKDSLIRGGGIFSMASKKRTWHYLKGRIREEIPQPIYKVWFESLEGEIKGENLTIVAPNDFARAWIKENYGALLDRVVREAGLNSYEIVTSNQPKAEQLVIPYNPLDLFGRRFSPKYTLDNFVVGRCNELAYKVCYRLVEEKPKGYFIYLCGHYGLGKTHLAQAVGNDLLKQGFERVYYFTAQDFLNYLIKYLKSGQIESFKNKIREQCDLFLLDGVHFFSGKEFTQSELAFLLDYLLDQGKTVVFTSLKLPQELESLDSSLRSRLTAGLIVKLNQPDLETRRKIIRFKAKREGYKLPYEVVDYLARNLRGDIRQLESSVLGLIARATLLKEPITLQLAKELVSEITLGKEGNSDVEIILESLSRFFGITRDEIFSSSRKRHISLARKALIYLLRNYAGKNLKEIAQVLKKEHSTIIHHLKSFERKLAEDRTFRFRFDHLIKEISLELPGESGERSLQSEVLSEPLLGRAT